MYVSLISQTTQNKSIYSDNAKITKPLYLKPLSYVIEIISFKFYIRTVIDTQLSLCISVFYQLLCFILILMQLILKCVVFTDFMSILMLIMLLCSY